MPPFIKVKMDVFKEVEKRLKYRFFDKERERSNRAAGMAALAQGTKRRCPLAHDQIAWSGPPHDKIRTYICLRCNACACEPEIRGRGFDFDTVPDWIILEIMDMDLQRQAAGSPRLFGGLGGDGF